MKYLKNKLITTKFTMLLAVLVFVSMSILGIITYSSFSKMVDEKVAVLSENLSKLIDKNLDYIISDVQDTSDLLLTSSAIQKSLIYAGNEKYLIEYNESRMDTVDLMNNMVNNKTCISAVYIGSENMNIISRDGEKFSLKISAVDYNNPPWWLSTIFNNRGKGIWFHGRTMVDFDGNLLVYGREIKNLNTLQRLGIMLIALDTALLDDIFREVEASNNMNIFIWEGKELIYSFGGNGLLKSENMQYDDVGRGNGFIELGGVRCYVHNTENAQSNWHISCIVPYGDFEKEKSRIMFFVVGLEVLLLLVATFVGYHITRSSIMSTLRQLRQFVDSFREKGSSETFVFNPHDEVGAIGDEFVRIVQENERLIVSLYKSRYREKEAELIALQSEINPHFLYNTLDSIFWAAEEYGAENVANMSVALSNVFRMSLNQGKSICTLKEELELVQNYMVVQNMRFNGRFQLQIDLSPELIEMQVIKLILQPVVENAVQHGLEGRAGKGKICIRSMEKEGDITLIIQDDGVGFQVDKAKPLGNGYALHNVNERIKLYYGEEYGVRIESEPGVGTTVYIALRRKITYRNLYDEKGE
ncbi:MAG: histidine kinase [Eubacteriales bacterium]|nr:histidine kinase [Eubacteriales bacterium]